MKLAIFCAWLMGALWLGEVLGLHKVYVREGVVFSHSGQVHFFDGHYSMVVVIKKAQVTDILSAMKGYLKGLRC